MAGVLGSVFGASTAIATAWITQKTLHKRELIRAEIDKREMLYGEFIVGGIRCRCDVEIKWIK